MRRTLVFPMLVLAFSALVVACGDDDATSSGSTPTAPAPRRIVVEAPIDDAELITRESFPPQYAVRVVVGIVDGCHEFDGVEAQRSGASITIKATATTFDDPEIACTQIYGTHEELVELGSDFDKDVEYTVKAGDKTFTITGTGPAPAE
jgi:hypothetical protein